MDSVRRLHRWVEQLALPLGPAPTRSQLWDNATRQLAGAALVALAAAIAHRTGHGGQQWQYLAIAAALLPQLLLDVLALVEARRRARLRTSPRPARTPLLAAAALGVAAPVVLVTDAAAAQAAAALCAAAGLALAASPVTVTFAPRRPGPRPAASEPRG
ncbi:MAG TPA: hypothetical protein VF049_08920 [Nocardioidaceae bacterium]|jgi:hypothetical protein